MLPSSTYAGTPTRVAVWVLLGNSRVTSKEQHCYFSVYQCSNCVIGHHIAGHSNLAVYNLFYVFFT